MALSSLSPHIIGKHLRPPVLGGQKGLQVYMLKRGSVYKVINVFNMIDSRVNSGSDKVL